MNHDGPSVPQAPPLPARPLQRARDAANRLFGYQSRVPSPASSPDSDRHARNVSLNARHTSLGFAQNARATHKTGLEIKTLSINDKGTHALLGGKEIFRTIRVEDGNCVQELDLRTAIRSSEKNASGKRRDIYSIDIADVAWARGDFEHYVAAATSSGKIILYDLGHAGVPAAQLHEHKQQVHKVTFNPHKGNLLLSGSHDGTVRLWDVRDVKTQASALQARRKYSGQADGVRDVKWSPTDGMEFGIGTDSGWIQCWDIRNLSMAKVKIPAHSLACNIVDWHPDGKHILSAGLDKTVRIWDFSSNRTKRPSWEIKGPFPVLNARWRPLCESWFPQDGGARMCTQIVTAYDREHPVINVWDLRRPHLPFRELSPYASAPTDLLWHSQDLLWTVGREGVFVQTDISHAPKVIDRRNLQALAISSTGEASFFLQKRSQRRIPKLPHAVSSTTFSSQSTNNLSVSPEHSLLARAWTDDTLDQSFLSSSNSSTRGKHVRSPSFTRMPHHIQAVIKLDELLNNRKSSTPEQAAVRTQQLPFLANREAFAYLAKNYVPHIPLHTRMGDELLQAVKFAFDSNSHFARSAGLDRLGKTWEILGFVTTNHLRQKIKTRENRQKSGLARPNQKAGDLTLGEMAKRYLLHSSKSPVHSATSVPIISSIAHQLAHQESTSNVPTPLAKPVTAERPGHTNTLLDPDQEETLVLPPSLTSKPDRPVLAENQPLTSDNLRDLHEQQNCKESSQRMDMVKRWSIQSKVPLSLDPPPSNEIPIRPALVKHDSGESFAFLGESSSDSRVPSLGSSFVSSASAPKNMVSERPSRPQNIPLNGAARAPSPKPIEYSNGEMSPKTIPRNPDRGQEQQEHTEKYLAFPEILDAIEPCADDANFDSEEDKPFTVVGMLSELLSYHTGKYSDAQIGAHLITLLVPLLPPTHPLSDLETDAIVANYADTFSSLGHLPDEVSALIDRHLGHIVQAGLNPLQLEAIVCTYHDQLMANELFVEAAAVRKMSFPHFPSVYEDALQDNTIHFACGACGAALMPSNTGIRCDKCSFDRGACPMCWSETSPEGNAKLFTTCLLCGHSGHMDCMRSWFELGAGACPTERCLCDCAPGRLRDQYAREAERERTAATTRGHMRVRSDEWRASESKAVEGARNALNGGASA